MSKILISYRREDSADVTGRIYDRLILVFPQSVFRDVDSIPLGVDFRAYLDEQVAKCDVFLAVIGRDWLRGKGRKGKSRLEDPGDFVRIEIESALKRQIPVIPVLVGGATIPPAQRLPASIQDMSYRNGIVVRPDPDFHKDMDRLIANLKQLVQRLREPQTGIDDQTTPFLTEIKPFSPAAVGDETRSSPILIAEVPSPRPAQTREPRDSQGAGPPGMVRIPKGPFLYGDKKARVVIDHDYWIDKFPVTNEKYRAFIEVNGYGTEAYWSPYGWKWKTENNITGPAYWNDPTWNKEDHPVVGVSYYEAEAYARWAGKRLPTEQEWEKAARGEDGREYPWGEEFDKNKCNGGESDIDHTTPVTQYPNGVSPYGCFDMAGNVWEWCSSWYDESSGLHVVRGGSWNRTPGLLRASDRNRSPPSTGPTPWVSVSFRTFRNPVPFAL